MTKSNLIRNLSNAHTELCEKLENGLISYDNFVIVSDSILNAMYTFCNNYNYDLENELMNKILTSKKEKGGKK